MKAIVDVEKHFCKNYNMKDLGCVHGMLGCGKFLLMNMLESTLCYTDKVCLDMY